jgi:hypothetical protein
MALTNITLSAEKNLLEEARQAARSRSTTLNALFREWLVDLTARTKRAAEYDALMQRLRYADAGRKFTRDEMNER